MSLNPAQSETLEALDEGCANATAMARFLRDLSKIESPQWLDANRDTVLDMMASLEMLRLQVERFYNRPHGSVA